jgi:lysylphosphatidylglycerol synthetase-like protein (DUF2156 family)
MRQTKHKQQVIFQVFLPLAFVLLIAAAVLGLFFTKLPPGSLDYQIWSNISVLVITLPLIFLSFMLFIGTCFAIYLIFIVKRKMTNILDKLTAFSSKSSRFTVNILGSISKPVIQIGSVLFPMRMTNTKSTGKSHESK